MKLETKYNNFHRKRLIWKCSLQCLKLSKKSCRSSCLKFQIINIKLKQKSTKSSRSSSKVVCLGLVDLWEFPTLVVWRIMISVSKCWQRVNSRDMDIIIILSRTNDATNQKEIILPSGRQSLSKLNVNWSISLGGPNHPHLEFYQERTTFIEFRVNKKEHYEYKYEF